MARHFHRHQTIHSMFELLRQRYSAARHTPRQCLLVSITRRQPKAESKKVLWEILTLVHQYVIVFWRNFDGFQEASADIPNLSGSIAGTSRHRVAKAPLFTQARW